jgi:aryl-alcohol dehydrogenase-like predicted oxidoreductase
MFDLGKRERVGQTKLWIARVGLGTAPLGNLYEPVMEEEAISTVRKAVEVGFTHVDTAPFYGFGLSEERVGKALSAVGRDRFTLSTKVGRVLVRSGRTEAMGQSYWAVQSRMTAVFDFSAGGVKKSIEGSRRRLMLDRFEILLLHDCDQHVEQALREAYPVLARMRDSGETDAIGAGLNSHETALKLAREEQFDCFLLAGRYTLLEQGAMDEFLPLCHDERIGVLAGGPFNSGILASDPSPGSRYNYDRVPADVLEKARRIKEVCDRHGVPLRAAALQFILAHPTVTSVIPGCRSRAEVESNRRALDVRIPRALWEDLKGEGLLREDAPTP